MSQLTEFLRRGLARLPGLSRHRVSRDQGIELLDQLEGLIAAGLPLDRALHILSSALETTALKSLVVNILLEIEKGHTLADALARHAEVFDSLEISMVRAGEEGGILPLVLRRVVEYRRSQQEFRRFLLTTSIYPLTLFMFGLFAVTGILLFVVPKFVEVYADLATANVSSMLLIGLSNGLQAYGRQGLAISLLILLGLNFWLKTPRGKLTAQAFLLGVPGMGGLIIKSELARVLHTLGVLLGAGVPILPALRLSRSLTTFTGLEQAFIDAEKSLREGRGLAKPFLANPIFPRLVGQMATVGEESGALDTMLIKVAERLEENVRSRLKALLALLEPLLIIGIGVVIGAVVVSMLAAIFSLNEMPL